MSILFLLVLVACYTDWGGCVDVTSITRVAITRTLLARLSLIDHGHPFLMRSQKYDARVGLEPLTHQPRSETLSTGPPWQVMILVTYLSCFIAYVPVFALAVALVSGRTASAAAEP